MFETKNRRLYGAIVIVLLAAGAILFTLLRGTDKSQSQANSQSQQSQQTQQTQSQSSQNKGYIDSVAADDPYAKGVHHVRIVVKDYGTIEATLNANVAPITVSNFAHLAESGFYNGLTFHRIIDGFMIQGGDPKGNGSGGSENKIKGEFTKNGVENNISHTRGTISMARAQDPNSASSQFFIMQADNSTLNGNYAAFGTVTSGMDVVDAICKGIKPTDSNGTIPASEQPVIESITMID